MKMFVSKSTITAFALGALLFGSHIVFSAFQEPLQGTPPDNNTPAPLNVGGTFQQKDGGLILNHGDGTSSGAATNGFAVEFGKVGIGTLSPAQKLHIVGGKAQADDFCLNSDTKKCLTNASQGGGVWNGYKYVPDGTEIHCRAYERNNANSARGDYYAKVESNQILMRVTLHDNVQHKLADSGWQNGTRVCTGVTVLEPDEPSNYCVELTQNISHLEDYDQIYTTADINPSKAGIKGSGSKQSCAVVWP